MMRRIIAASIVMVGTMVLIAADPPPLEVLRGTVKEVRTLKPGIVFSRSTDGSYGSQVVTDFQRLSEKCEVILNEAKVKLSDIRAGDRVEMVLDRKTSLVIKITATSPDALARLKKREEESKAVERAAEAEYQRLLRKTAGEMAAKQKAALEKLAKDRAAKEKAKEKSKDSPKDKSG